eukprot:766876-Ditylum_brightwellii.AAC.1
MTSEEIVLAKKAFEAYARQREVTIKHYHANNSRFVDQGFTNAIWKSGQPISYCAAYVHHQNGKTEKMIRDFSGSTRKQLLHASSRWPK